MNASDWLESYLLVGALLFAIGLIGLTVRRNMLVMFISIEIMLQGIALNFVAWGRYHGDLSGSVMVLMIIAVAACEAAIALTLILILARRSGSLDINVWQALRERQRPAHVDQRIPLEEEPFEAWPRLTPAGIEPESSEEETIYRSRV